MNEKQKMIDAEMVTGMELNKRNCKRFEQPCDVCVRAKQTSFPFNTESNKTLVQLHWTPKGTYLQWFFVELKSESAGYIKDYINENEWNQNKMVVKIRCERVIFKQWINRLL